MAGNACEWCMDWYDPDYYARSPRYNPNGPKSGEWHVARGGSWFTNDPFTMCVATRYGSDFLQPLLNGDNVEYVFLFCIGFRCVLTP
jgi:formylglycine-generating enzyme required for sulfatase activity